MNEVILNGIFTLSGVILGSLLTYILTWLANKGNLHISINKLTLEAHNKTDEKGDRLANKNIFADNVEQISFAINLFVHNSKNNNISMSNICLELEDYLGRIYVIPLHEMNLNMCVNRVYNFPAKTTINLNLKSGIDVVETKKEILLNRNTKIKLTYTNDKNKNKCIKNSKMFLKDYKEKFNKGKNKWHK
ncbi:MAG: hypothetical protein PHC46_04265 [Clostridia bacterium]|nr:hypothetical protein [Clostridia bacterium]